MTPTNYQLKDLLVRVTPGDWSACKVSDNDGPEDVVMAGDSFVASCHAGMRGAPEESNARLIALAPTLAAEVVRLREALAFYAEFHQYPNAGPWGMNSNDYGDIARQALSQKQSRSGAFNTCASRCDVR